MSKNTPHTLNRVHKKHLESIIIVKMIINLGQIGFQIQPKFRDIKLAWITLEKIIKM